MFRPFHLARTYRTMQGTDFPKLSTLLARFASPLAPDQQAYLSTPRFACPPFGVKAPGEPKRSGALLTPSPCSVVLAITGE